MERKCCCKECTERHIGCHGTCEKYKQWVAQYREDVKKAKCVQNRYANYFYKGGNNKAW